jgi:hypothetical protein
MNKFRQFLSNYRNALIAWLLIILFIEFGVSYRIDKSIVAVAVLLVGILGQAFAALLAWIGLVPVVGPMIAHVLSLPFLWLLNGVGYLVSIIAIRRGYSKDVLLTGITIGHVLGKLI